MFTPKIVFTDITRLPQLEQIDKLAGFKALVSEESRKLVYPSKWRDYHYHVINGNVVNMIAVIAQVLKRPEIDSSPYIIMGMDYNGFFLFASVSEDTIKEWTKYE